MRLLAAFVFAVFATACATAPDPAERAAQTPPRTAWLVGVDGAAIGQVRFAETPGGVVIRLQVPPNALAPQWYAASLTERGDCSDFAGGFGSAGPVIGANSNPNSNYQPSPGVGELPPFEAPAGAPLVGEIRAPNFTLGVQRVGDRWPLLDRDGSALVLSTGIEQNGPEGGRRVACAALTQLP